MKKLSVLLFFILLLLLVLPVPAYAKSYHIKISITKCRLWLYEQNGNRLELIREYEVGTAKKGLKEYPVGTFKVVAIEFNPIWYPTDRTRQDFERKKGIILPKKIPYGDKLNYMGAVKIKFSYIGGKECISRIHGTRPQDDHLVGKRVSRWCVRMHNKEGVELAKTISIGTIVNIVL